MRFLIAESEPPEDRQRRRDSVGRSAGETYIDTLRELVPSATCDRVTPADAPADALADELADLPDTAALAGYDAVFLTGSPLHLYEDTPEVRREIAFMRAVFASGTPSFGSCAGLQIATVAAGGTVRQMRERHEAGFARRITPTEAGRGHPLLRGRPPAFDAPAIHGDEVERLPEGATLLASNAVTTVQAAEIRSGEGVFWGVQYHPELPLGEVAAALRRQADDLIEHGLATSEAEVEDVATKVEALLDEGSRQAAAWQLGLDAQVVENGKRQTEIVNFIEHLVRPTRERRGRG